MTDPTIIEAAARALQSASAWTIGTNRARAYVETVISYVKPGIEAAALERAARAFEADKDGHDIHNDRYYGSQIAAALRALKQEAGK